MIDVRIVDGTGINGHACVTNNGILATGPLNFDETFFNDMDTINTAYNFYEPIDNKQFLIRGVFAFATRDVNDNSSTIIDIYEADTPTQTSIDKTLLQFGMGSLTTASFSPLNIVVNKGKFVNAKTDDNSILMNITGYYIDRLS
jgi:hypothetical protein